MKAVAEPWSTPKWDRAWRKWVREEHRRCREQNPALMGRLRRLSDDQLLRLEIALLELAPVTALHAYQLRTARDLLALRLAPKLPINPHRESTPANEPALSVQEHTPEQLGGLTPPGLFPPPAATAASKAARSKPTAPPPDNVIRPHFGPKAFGIGGKSFWIGGEV